MSGGGFFVTARRLFEHPMFAGEAYSRREAWLWMIGEAAWKDTPELKRGQLSHSVRFMAVKFGWTAPKVQRFLASLKADTMVDTVADTGRLVITICNYNKYQKADRSTIAPLDTPRDTKEKKKKQIEEKKERLSVAARPNEPFNEFWKAYPKREGSNPKHPAQLKFNAAIKNGTAASNIIASARQYAAQVQRLKTEPRFVAQAVTWLNQQRWNDDGPAQKPTMTKEEIQALLNSIRTGT